LNTLLEDIAFASVLIKDRNEEYLHETIERMKANGLTEEELGKVTKLLLTRGFLAMLASANTYSSTYR
jgi:hypothetical protein